MDSLRYRQVTRAQILKLEKGQVNPLTKQRWSANHADILAKRQELPFNSSVQLLLDLIHENPVVILRSETGSGKTTQAAQAILYDEWASTSELRIACRQPRRMAATQVAARVALEMEVVLGEEVGYLIRGDRCYDKADKKSRLVYMTEGVLLNKLKADKLLKEFSVVIVDEAHEKTWELDLILALLKKIQARREDLKVIFMSATIESGLFQKYFNDCPTLDIPGRNFPAEMMYIHQKDTSPDVVMLATHVVADIHKHEPKGDILVFLPGEEEIERARKLVNQCCKDVDTFPLHSQLSTLAKQAAVAPSTTGRRKVIIATNIAETSLTINRVVYVVDSGMAKQAVFNPRLRMHRLETRVASRAAGQQRAGRAGRTCPGQCYRLYSMEQYEKHPLSTQPSTRTVPLDQALLTLLHFKFNKLMSFDWITPPDPEQVARSAQDLEDWGFITRGEKVLTKHGQLANRMPIDQIWVHTLLAAKDFRCTMDIAIIASMRAAKAPIFRRPLGFRRVADLAVSAFKHPLSDHLTLLNVYNAYLHCQTQHCDSETFCVRTWCDDHAINMFALEEARDTFDNLKAIMDQAGFPLSSASVTDRTPILKALAVGFATRSAIWHAPDEYRTVHERSPALIEPRSALVGQDHEWVIYDEYHQRDKKQYLEIITAVKAEWLMDLPFFDTTRLSWKTNGELRQPNVQQSLDAARARRGPPGSN